MKRGAKIVQLGNHLMSSGLIAHEADGGPEQNNHNVQALLTEALALVDALQLPAEIGARLQEVIDMVSKTPIQNNGSAEESCS